MALKDNLQHIFNSDYPGTDTFINKVIIPVFGDDIDIVNIDQAEKEEYREKAAKAGLKKIVYAADIHDEEYRANNIAFFDVTVDNNVNVERARVNIQQVIRSIVDHHSHILIVFHYEDVEDKPWRFSYAYKHGSIADTTSAKRYTYVFGRDFRGRTAAERFETFKKSNHSNKALEEAFSVEALSDEFFDKYRAYYAAFVEYITGEKYSKETKLKNIMNGWKWRAKDTSDQFSTTFDSDAKATRDYIKKMFGRIVFLYFLQRKGWLYDNQGRSDAQYMKHLFDNAGTLQASFLDDVLEILFFYVLNTKPENRVTEARMAHKDVTILPGWEKIPFLNGGLFEQDDIDPKKCTFPTEYFREFFNFLNSYNFTIDENDQEDAEIGIDPEMLGRIFENLLEDNKDKGAFYTPKPIVDYMCRESIIAYLQDDRYKPEGNELIRKFIETLNIDLLNEEQRIEIENKLLKVKICDPAIGSGAFPMGLVNLLSKIFIVLRTYSTIDQAKMKRYIMQQSIYGVDIEKGAVDIARLRFWLAMVVDETEPQPLPNLHFKIMQGNSLLEYFNGLNLESLMKSESGTIDYITEQERKQLRKDLARFYAEDDHDKRLVLMNNIKNTVIRMILNADPNSPLSGIDVSETDQFFMWHTWFSDVFDNGGFDIVIGNPPYVIISKEDKNKSIYDNTFEVASGGKRNLYHLFFELSYKILKREGVLSFITPDTYIASNDTKKLREFFLYNGTIQEIVLYTEKDRVFENVTQALAVSRMIKDPHFSDFTLIKGKESFTIYKEDILSDSKKRFKQRNNIILKINHINTKFKDFFDGNKGDVNLGLKKDYFVDIEAEGSLPLVRGIQISPYKYLGSNQWCLKGALSKDNTNANRIVFQEVSNAGLNRRVKGTILKNVILGDSCNYIVPNIRCPFDIYCGLGILNSHLVNYYFKFYNQTNHVPIGEIKEIPLPLIPEIFATKISNIVQIVLDINQKSSVSDISNYENEIDHLVYHLYDLTYDEVLIIDPETPITREEFENFKIEE